MNQFHATLHQLEQAINRLAPSTKETLEASVDNTEHDFVLEQVEEAAIIEEDELVEDLGDAEPPWESRIVDNSVK